MNKHIEDDNQKALFDWAAHIPDLRWMHCIPNGAFLAGDKLKRAKQMSRLKKQGLKPGVWDIFLPVARNGHHGLYIEMKAGKNKLTDNQAEFGGFAHEQGYLTHICYTWLEAKEVICDYMEIGK